MSVAHPLDGHVSEIDVIVAKLRAREPLTERERALVNKRGEELMNLTDEPLPGETPAEELSDEEAEHLCEALVEAEADQREGKLGTPWRELFPNHAG